MRLRPGSRPTREAVTRMVADGLLINGTLLLSFTIHFLYLLNYGATQAGLVDRRLFAQYLTTYRNSAPFIVVMCLMAGYVSGFYTYGRAYRGRYKVLVIALAVTFTYGMYGLIAHFSGDAFQLPRGVMGLGWGLAVSALIVARLCAHIWAGIVRREQHSLLPLEQQSIRNVLLIGGAGYIGSALLPKLLDRGCHVRLLDLLLYGTEPIQDLLHHPRLEVMQADFRHVDQVLKAMRDMDAVIHLGAIVGDPACALDEDLTIEVNLMATRMIAEVAKANGINRFIFASTCSVYGASDHILTERSPLNPVSLYARSKIASERVLLEMADDRFAPVILRFSTIYGLSGRTRFDLVVNLLTAKAMVDGQITVFGGDQWRPFLHVDDAALAVLKALQAPLSKVRHQVFNVGSDEQNHTILQVGQRIKDLVPSAQLINETGDGDRRNYRVDFTRVRTVLQFTPQWTMEDGIRQVIEAMQNGTVTDYRDAKYSNVRFLSEEGIDRLLHPQSLWAWELINGVSPPAYSEPIAA